MKKDFILIMIIMMVFQGSMITAYDVTQENGICLSEENCSFDNGQFYEEYSGPDDQCNISEYDEQICDDVQPPKISAVRALLTEWLGALLVRYITLREMAPLYFKKFKDIVSRWLRW